MIQRALAALALGSFIFTTLLGSPETTWAELPSPIPNQLIERYQQALAADPGNLTLHYLLGVAMLREGNNVAAMSELQTAYPAYRDSIEAHYNLGVASLRLSDLDSSEIYLEQAEVLGAANMPGTYPLDDLYLNLALRYLEADNANEAIRFFHKVLRLNPDRHEVQRQLGDLYARRGDTNLALQAFRKYLKQFPDDPVSRDYLFALEFNRAQDLLAADDLTAAAAGFSAALELQPQSPTALYYLGYIAYTNSNPSLAVMLLNQAYLEADDNLQQSLRPLLYNSSLALRTEQKLKSALDAVTTLAERQDARFNELFLAGTLNLELGYYRAAENALQRSVALNPAHAGAQQNLLLAEQGAFQEWIVEAKLYLAEQQLDEAAAALQEANKLQPQNLRAKALHNQIEQTRLKLASAHFFNAQTALDASDLSLAFQEVTQGLLFLPDNSDGLILREKITFALRLGLQTQLATAEAHLQNESWDEAEQTFAHILNIAPENLEAAEGLKRVHQAKSTKAQQWLKQGQQAIDAGQAEQASAAFSEALTLDSTLSEAVTGLTIAKELLSNRLEEYLHSGRQALESKEFNTARDWFSKALKIEESPRIQNELARLDKALSQTAEELLSEAEQAIAEQNFNAAEKLYDQALQLLPTHARAQSGQQALATRKKASINKELAIGSAASQQGHYATATKAYQAVLKLSPDNPQALDGLRLSRKQQADGLNKLTVQGETALANGDHAAAEQYLSAALKQDAFHKGALALRQRLEDVKLSGAQPGDEQRLYLQGVAYYTQGKYAEAIKAWETVLLLDPGHEKSRQNIAKTQRKLRQIQEYRGV